MRNVGGESRKTYLDKLSSGFFLKYMYGNGLDIGYKGYEEDIVPILAGTKGIDLQTPGYDGTHLPFEDNSQQHIYSSHVLEHISNRKEVIQEWLRVVKPGGYIVTIVPHRDLYEKKASPPSQFNGDHKVFFTPASLLKEFEDALPINSFRVRHMQDNDKGHRYEDPSDVHGCWEYEIELVIQKL